jgi:glycosyltransferase involved in cell wall biosynthesis
MSSKPHVAILHYAAPPGVGGVEVTILHHGRLLARNGYPVTVIAGRGESWNPGVRLTLVPELDSQHPEVVAISEQLEEGHCPSEQFDGLQARLHAALRDALADIPVCLVHNVLSLHFNLPLTAAIYQLIDEGFPTRFVAWNHDFSWTDPLHRAKVHEGYPWGLLRTPSPHLTYVTVSDDRRDELASLLNLPPDRIRVITPGVGPTSFFRLAPATRRVVERLGLFDADMRLLLPARITELKNIELGIEVTAALKRQGADARLIVTGPPDPHDPRKASYLEQLLELRADLDVVDEAIFLYQQGTSPDEPFHVPDEMIGDLYQVCDALLFPSKQEGFGIPVLEAGLARLPVFCSDIPPFRESAGDIANFFSLDEPPDSIAGRIREVLARDETYTMRQRVLQTYSWRQIFAKHIEPLVLSLAAGD